MKALAPDVVIGCLESSGCESWVRQAKAQDFSPKATILSYCVSRLDAVARLGDDSRYLIGAGPWDASINEVDALVGWDSQEFGNRMEQYLNQPPNGFSATAVGALSTLIQAVERAASTSTAAVAAELANGTFQTLLGPVSFDEVRGCTDT